VTISNEFVFYLPCTRTVFSSIIRHFALQQDVDAQGFCRRVFGEYPVRWAMSYLYRTDLTARSEPEVSSANGKAIFENLLQSTGMIALSALAVRISCTATWNLKQAVLSQGNLR